MLLARPDRKDERRRFGKLAGMRQWIEAIFDTLKDQLSLERHGGRTRCRSVLLPIVMFSQRLSRAWWRAGAARRDLRLARACRYPSDMSEAGRAVRGNRRCSW